MRKSLLVLSLCIFFLLPVKAFVVNGIAYTILDQTNQIGTVGVSPNWESPTPYSGNIIIPSSVTFDGVTYSVTTIGSYAFSGCTGLTSVDIPNSVTTIEDLAFQGCGIESIVIPDNVSKIGDAAFEFCFYLKDVSLPSGLTELPNRLFNGCSNLEEIDLPESILSIGDGAFSYSSLKNVLIPNSTLTIGEAAFSGCDFKSVALGNSVEFLGSWAFQDCANLTDIVLPESLKELGYGAFTNCSSLIRIEIPESITVIESNMFDRCNALERVKLPTKVTEIGGMAFAHCESLRSITLPSTLTDIGSQAFYGCNSLSEIILPNSVEKIEYTTFKNCSALTNVVLGTGLYEIGVEAFEGCDNISTIYCLAQNPPYAESNAVPSSIFNKATLYVQEQALSAYTRQNPWQRFTKVNTVNSGIQLSHYDVNMAGNQVFQLGVYGSDNKVVWSASNPDVAYANECGLVVGRGITGSSIITATVDGVSVSCRVNVTSPRQARGTRAGEDEDVQPVDIIIESIGGNPPMVNARLVPVGSKTVIDWSSSNNSVATVEDGLVTIISEGYVDFGAESGNGLEDSYEIDTEDIDITGIVLIESQNVRSNDIYTLQGVCVKRGATQSDIDALAPGLYIIAGRKVIVK